MLFMSSLAVAMLGGISREGVPSHGGSHPAGERRASSCVAWPNVCPPSGVCDSWRVLLLGAAALFAALGEAGGAQLDWWSASGGSRGAGASPGQTLQMYVSVSPSACAFFILVDSASDAGGEAMEELWNSMVPEAAELLRMPGKAERDDPWMSRSQMRGASRTGYRERAERW